MGSFEGRRCESDQGRVACRGEHLAGVGCSWAPPILDAHRIAGIQLHTQTLTILRCDVRTTPNISRKAIPVVPLR